MRKEDAVWEALRNAHMKTMRGTFAEPASWQENLMLEIRQLPRPPSWAQTLEAGEILRAAWGMLAASVVAALILAIVQVFWQTDGQIMAMGADSVYNYFLTL